LQIGDLDRTVYLEAFAIASGEDDAGALGAGTSSGFKAYARAAANDDDGLAEQFRPGPGIVEAVVLMTPPVETISSPVRSNKRRANSAPSAPRPSMPTILLPCSRSFRICRARLTMLWSLPALLTIALLSKCPRRRHDRDSPSTCCSRSTLHAAPPARSGRPAP
jgi:hypothetical protein